jgi:putative selenate reductase molybdopterin-binding subunit
MDIQVTINGVEKRIACAPGETLMRVLRREGYFSVRFGSDTGETGAAAILLDGKLINSDVMLAAQADGHTIETIEGLSRGLDLHPIQQAFIRTGAIQSGYSTPAMILAAKALIERNPNPTEAEVRDALSGILCRETGYLKPVQAVLEAAAVMRGEEPTPVELNVLPPILPPGSEYADLFRPGGDEGEAEAEGPNTGFEDGWDRQPSSPTPQPSPVVTMPKFVVAPEAPETKVVGKPETKVDAVKLAKGNPAFVDDIDMRGLIVKRAPSPASMPSFITRTSPG